jgi:lysophospholipase L1-like esterase
MPPESDPPPQLVVHLIGDSTMSVRPASPTPASFGWGQLLGQQFMENVSVRNHARSGRSTKSFIDEGLWSRVREQLQAGHYLIMQFGRNDQKTNRPDLYGEARVGFKENLRRFVREARDKGAEPILATPLIRRRFDRHGRLRDNMGDYPDAMRELALEEGTPLLDLHRGSEALLSRFGPEGSKALVWWLDPGIDPSLPEGRQDNSHLSEEGARQVCRLAAAALREANSPLARYLADADRDP